mmetsp:Transcript_17763/g.33714  ORF Transcript_17763/g.33714 Transcript_17763/m.33714 type:complete len:565 (-) Transcript_17763:149-1843(-)
MADPRDFPDDHEGPDGTGIDFPFLLRAGRETESSVIGSVVVIDEQNEGRIEGTSGGSPEEGTSINESTEKTSGIPPWVESMGLGGVYNMANIFPRVHGVLVGVVMPLIFLVGAAIFFGQGIVWAEAAPELNRNNDAMMEASLATHLQTLLTGYAERSLLFCLSVRAAGGTEVTFGNSLKNVTADILREDVSLYNLIESPDLSDMQMQYALVEPTALGDIANVFQAGTRLAECDSFTRTISREVFGVVPVLSKLSEPRLTFHWNQCIRSGDPQEGFPNNYHPGAQSAYFEEMWKTSRDRQYNPETRPPPIDYTLLQEASLLASASEFCVYNAMGASWFWFTVMASIGYGDVVPQTDIGRMFIYTAGFTSIIMFFGVLGKAGKTMNQVVEDLLENMNCTSFRSASFGLVCCLGLYFAWMLLLGKYFTDWTDTNFGVEVKMLDGYWFAFDSLSTIGFGEFSPQIEVFQLSDMLIYSALYLTGFFFLSMGYSKLLDLLATTGEDEVSNTLVVRLDAAPLSGDSSTFADQQETPSERPAQDTDIATLTGTINDTFRLDTHSVITPMETV